jgi:pimeloyl-ACP methyl ester carboxylesterase
MLFASRMARFSSLLAAAAFVAANAAAQALIPVGRHDLAWPNPTAIGSATLFARIHYPATVAGFDTPPLPSPSGWPTVVFLHGYGQIGSDYNQLAAAWSEQGYAVVALDTARFDFALLRDDAIAVRQAIQIANMATGTLTDGLFDVGRMMLAGHSMGGGVTALVLATNPGYRAGLALAPFDPTQVVGPIAASVLTPFGIVAGDGDVITPPALHAAPLFTTLGVPQGLKFFYRFDASCGHLEVAGLQVGANDPSFLSALQVSSGFLGHALGTRNDGLEQCIGDAAQTNPQLVSLSQQFGLAEAWASRPLQIGATTRYSIGVEPGLGVAVLSGGSIPPVPTPFGDQRVDPFTAFVGAIGVVGAERRLDFDVAVAFDPQLVGVELAVQAFGTTATQPMWLGSAVSTVVLP